MLYGPPGTGKTSFVLAIAGNLKLNICVLSLQSDDLTEETLIQAFESIPAKSIILLKDVNRLF